MAELLFGADSNINIPDRSDLDLSVTTGWTILFRGKIAATTYERWILTVRNGSYLSNYLDFRLNQTTHSPARSLDGRVKSNNGTQRTWDAAASTPAAPTEDHVYFIYCTTAGIPYIGFCTPAGAVSKTFASSGLNDVLGGPWTIGAGRDNESGNITTSGLLDGCTIESFGIAAQEMSDAQIAEYAAGAALPDVTGISLTRWYPIEEGSGTVINEASNVGDSAFQGVFSGTITWQGDISASATITESDTTEADAITATLTLPAGVSGSISEADTTEVDAISATLTTPGGTIVIDQPANRVEYWSGGAIVVGNGINIDIHLFAYNDVTSHIETFSDVAVTSGYPAALNSVNISESTQYTMIYYYDGLPIGQQYSQPMHITSET